MRTGCVPSVVIQNVIGNPATLFYCKHVTTGIRPNGTLWRLPLQYRFKAKRLRMSKRQTVIRQLRLSNFPLKSKIDIYNFFFIAIPDGKSNKLKCKVLLRIVINGFIERALFREDLSQLQRKKLFSSKIQCF